MIIWYSLGSGSIGDNDCHKGASLEELEASWEGLGADLEGLEVGWEGEAR